MILLKKPNLWRCSDSLACLTVIACIQPYVEIIIGRQTYDAAPGETYAAQIITPAIR